MRMAARRAMRAAVAGYVDGAAPRLPGAGRHVPARGAGAAAAARRPRRLHGGRGGRAQPAPAGHAGRGSGPLRGQEVELPGALPGPRVGAAVLRPGGRARARADRRARRRRRTPRCARAGDHHRRLPRGRPARLRADAAPRRARRLRAGQRALRGGARLRDDPQPGAGAGARWSTSWTGAAAAGLPRAQALLARAIAPHDAAVGGRPADAIPGARGARRPDPRRALAQGAGARTAVRRGETGVTDAHAARPSATPRGCSRRSCTREESIGVSELARRLGLGKSNVHRLLTTLVAEGLVEQDPPPAATGWAS